MPLILIPISIALRRFFIHIGTNKSLRLIIKNTSKALVKNPIKTSLIGGSLYTYSKSDIMRDFGKYVDKTKIELKDNAQEIIKDYGIEVGAALAVAIAVKLYLNKNKKKE